MRQRLTLALVLGGVAASILGAQSDPVPLMDGLGSHHLAITTDVPEAQDYFDQGLRLFYAFNFDESIRSFEEALRLDPACAMCQWGIAIALGPNVNAPMDPRRGQPTTTRTTPTPPCSTPRP